MSLVRRGGVQASPSSSRESTNSGTHSISHSHPTTSNKKSHSQSSLANENERVTASAEVMKTHHITIEHCYPKDIHLLGQPLPPTTLSSQTDRSFLSEVIPGSSKKPLCPEKQVPRVDNLLVERTEHILTIETGAWPPSLVGFDLGIETESDSSCDSSFETEEQQWMPFSLPVSFPLLQKSTVSNTVNSETDNSQSYPATQTKVLRRPRNGLYLYATRKGTSKDSPDETRQLSKKREVHFATDDENSKPEEKIKDTKCNGVMEIGSDEEQPASPGISQRLRKRKAQSAVRLCFYTKVKPDKRRWPSTSLYC